MVMADEKPTPEVIGAEFVRQYYTMLNEAPEFLYRFYNQNSSFIHGGIDPPDGAQPTTIGQQAIQKRIISLEFRDCHAKIAQVDAQATVGEAVVIQVSGELSNAGGPLRRFMQTFILAQMHPPSKNYYVHNDIFRYQDEVYLEDEEIEHEQETAVEVVEPQQWSDVTEGEEDWNQEPAHTMTNGHHDTQEPTEPIVEQTPTDLINTTPQPQQPIQPMHEQPQPMSIKPPTPEPQPTPTQQIQPDPAPVIEKENGEPPKDLGPRSWAALVNPNPQPVVHKVQTTNPPQPQQPAQPNTQQTEQHSSQDDSPNRPHNERQYNDRQYNDRQFGDRQFGGDRQMGGFGDREFGNKPDKVRYPDSQQLFVGGLPYDTSDAELKACFRNYGTVLEVRINRMNQNMKSAYGFVVFDNEGIVKDLLSGDKQVQFNGNNGESCMLNIEEKKVRAGMNRTGRNQPRQFNRNYNREGSGSRDGRRIGGIRPTPRR